MSLVKITCNWITQLILFGEFSDTESKSPYPETKKQNWKTESVWQATLKNCKKTQGNLAYFFKHIPCTILSMKSFLRLEEMFVEKCLIPIYSLWLDILFKLNRDSVHLEMEVCSDFFRIFLRSILLHFEVTKKCYKATFYYLCSFIDWFYFLFLFTGYLKQTRVLPFNWPAILI